MIINYIVIDVYLSMCKRITYAFVEIGLFVITTSFINLWINIIMEKNREREREKKNFNYALINVVFDILALLFTLCLHENTRRLKLVTT